MECPPGDDWRGVPPWRGWDEGMVGVLGDVA